MFTLTKVDKDTYSALDCTCLFEHEGSKSYAIIDFDGNLLKLAYPSTLVSPVIVGLDEMAIAIGIDFEVCIYSKRTYRISFVIKTDSYFCEFLIVQNKLLVFTELDVYLVDTDDYIVQMKHSYPDVYSSYSLENNILTIEYQDGDTFSVDLNRYLS